jgi:hypothetical protein
MSGEGSSSTAHTHGQDHGHDDPRAHEPANSLDTNTAQTPGMNRAAAINFARVGAQKLWAGTVTIHADAKTGAHHHGAWPLFFGLHACFDYHSKPKMVPLVVMLKWSDLAVTLGW